MRNDHVGKSRQTYLPSVMPRQCLMSDALTVTGDFFRMAKVAQDRDWRLDSIREGVQMLLGLDNCQEITSQKAFTELTTVILPGGPIYRAYCIPLSVEWKLGTSSKSSFGMIQ